MVETENEGTGYYNIVYNPPGSDSEEMAGRI